MPDMSSADICKIITKSELETEAVARRIGSRLRGGEVIELVSDLGGGKTTFTRGLAAGAGSADKVASPTFTLSKVYTLPDFNIHHFDFYRLADAGLAANELQDFINDPQAVVVVEWGKAVEKVLPEERLVINITHTSNEQSRELILNCPKLLKYLMEDIC